MPKTESGGGLVLASGGRQVVRAGQDAAGAVGAFDAGSPEAAWSAAQASIDDAEQAIRDLGATEVAREGDRLGVVGMIRDACDALISVRGKLEEAAGASRSVTVNYRRSASRL